MADWKRRLCSSWWRVSSPSSSTRLWGLMLPLMAILALAVFVTSRSSSWRYAFRGFENYTTTGFNDIISTADGAGGGVSAVDLKPTVVAAGQGREKALSVDSRLRSSRVAPPLSVEIAAVAPFPVPVEIDKKDGLTLTTSANKSNVDVVEFKSNGTSILPKSPKIIKKFSHLQLLEAKLQQARTAIRDAKSSPGQDPDYVPTGPVYWNAPAFHRSYLEMEKQFKVFVYEEGEQPIFHHGPCGSIYSMEGNFIYKLETSSFRTRDPEKAHVFFLPFSVVSIVRFIFDRSIRNYWNPMKGIVKDYIDLVAGKYPYWNRSIGFDHFMLSCHDWGPELSKSVPELFKNSIRALCNANTSEGFRPSKDVSIPEINLRGRRMNGLVGGPSPSKRPILAFFAGGVHGPIRPILLEHWENKDPDIQVNKYLPKNVSYQAMMRKSRFCICPSGYEVASPRVVESLYMGCVPVLIKDNYVPPFSDVLNWKMFAVVISKEDIPKLKNILTSISTRRYIRMHHRGLSVRRHFEINLPPKRFDVFHMTLHSIWLRRLNIDLHGRQDS